MKPNILVVVGVIALLSAGIYMYSGDKAKMADDKGTVTESVKVMDETKEMEDKPTAEDTEMMKAGVYAPYSADKVAMAETGDVVLFFHASWCPTCSALNKDIEKNMKAIPEKVTILKTDYDKEMELKKKYGVTYQHTLVQVDGKGNMIKKWSGGTTLETVISEIQ